MRILYDHQTFLQEVGGIPKYFSNLISSIKKVTNNKIETSVLINKCVYFKDIQNTITINSYHHALLNTILKKRPGRRLIWFINKSYTLFKLKRNAYDVLHVTNENCSYLLKKNIDIPLVITVHDLTPEIFPEYFPDTNSRLRRRKEIIQRADHIICISLSTKNDLIKFHGIDERKISMIYHGRPENINQLKVEIPEIPKNKQYLLFVGDRKAGYKNFWPMVRFIREWLLNENDLILVCIGSVFSELEHEQILKLNLESKIIAFHANENSLRSIYAGAACLIYPSMYEGFGLPLIEAMQAECAILSSNTSCLPEIGADACLYFDPLTFEGLIKGLECLMSDTNFKNQLIERQKERLKYFTWDKTARETVEAYSKAIRFKANKQ